MTDHASLVRFGPFTFDRTRMVLQRDGHPIPIGGRGAAILAVLADAGGQVVTRAELLDAVWRGQVVEERNLTVQIAALRKAMSGLPNNEDLIGTVSRVGYRLVLDGVSPRAPTIFTLRPKVAVLPFANLSGDPEMAFFANGVTEDLITALSRFRTFAVVARGSSSAYKGSAVPAPEVARALGVRYLLDGSIRREGRRLRMVARLSDASGIIRWADSFDEELDGVFEIQDRITTTVVGVVEPQITRAELERSRRKHPKNLDAYDHFLLGMEHYDNPNRGVKHYDQFIGHLDRAVELDPGFPLALARAGSAHELRRTWGAASPPGVDDFALASDLCDRAIALDGNDAVVLAIAAMERHNLQNDGEAALAMAERAVALTPNSYEVLKLAALIQRQRGRADSAIGLFERCYQLGPNSPDSAIFVENIGCCHLDRGRYTEAAEWIRRALGMGASWDLALVNLVVADAMQGEIEEAQATLERFLRVRPGATIQRVMERLPPGTRQSVEHVWPEGLRRAGLPEA